jgi:hypothetical protein
LLKTRTENFPHRVSSSQLSAARDPVVTIRRDVLVGRSGGKDALQRRVLSHTVRRLALGIAGATLAIACGGTTTEQVVGPTASRCQIVAAAPPAAIPASGSHVSLNVSTARDCTWSAVSEAAWVSVAPTSGQGSSSLAITVAANALGSPRSSVVAVNDTQVTITQQGVPCHFELGDQSARVGVAGGRVLVRISTIDGCDWRASSSAEWIRVVTENGTGSGTVDLDVSRNDGPERSATLSIAGNPFVVAQDSIAGGPGGSSGGPGNPPAAPAACSFSLEPERTTIRSAAGQVSIRVVTQPACPWTASSGTSWISLQRSDGSGPDTVTYQVLANLSTVSERSGSVDVAGRTHRVTQQACELTIEPGGAHLPPGSGSYDFWVSTNAGCTWTANATVDWINVTSPRGTGSGRVTYQLATNTGRGREGTIIVSGRVRNITQYGADSASSAVSTPWFYGAASLLTQRH